MVLSTKSIDADKTKHVLIATLHVPVPGAECYSTPNAITIEDDHKVHCIKFSDRRSGTRTCIDSQQFIASMKGIIITHSGIWHSL